MLLTEKVSYKINIDFAGRYVRDGKDYPVLALRLYILADKRQPDVRYGTNLASEGTNDFRHAAKTLGVRVRAWLKNKYGDEVDAVKWFLENSKLEDRFNRLAKLSVEEIGRASCRERV